VTYDDALRWARYAFRRDGAVYSEGAAIKAESAHAYLSAHGWRLSGKETKTCLIYNYGDPTTNVVRCPKEDGVFDHDDAMMHVVWRCHEVEGRPVFDIWCEMKEAKP